MGRPLRVRLVAGVALWQLLLAAGLVWLGIVFTGRQLRQAFDTELRGRLMSVAALARYPERGPGLIFDASRVPPARDRRHPALYQVESAGVVVASSFPAGVPLPAAGGGPPRRRNILEAEAAGAATAQYWRFRVGGTAYRGLMLSGVPILDSEEDRTGPPALLTVYYAAPTREVEREVTAAGLAIAGSSLVLLLLTTLLAAYSIGRELQPLQALAQQAAAISPRNWRFEPDARMAQATELQPLIQALERMLQRLQGSYQQQREFMADAAHHLKTPVAILKSTQQTLLRRPRDNAEYEAAAQASLLDVERLEQLLQRMLRLARLEQWAEDDRPRDLPPAEVGASCQAGLDRVRPLARARGVELRAQGLERKWELRADPEDLEQVWVNLLENSIQHSAPGSRVEIACGAGAGGWAQVEVRDQGTGIAAEEAALVFERFRRGRAGAAGEAGEAGEAGGFGLGLAIARTIVQAYGGRIGIVPQTGAGATLRVELPATAAAEH